MSSEGEPIILASSMDFSPERRMRPSRSLCVIAASLAVLLAGASRAATETPQVTTGVRLGWLSTTGAAREILTTGAPEPEGYVEVARSSSPFSLEASLSGYSLTGTESGSGIYSRSAFPIGYAFIQDMVVVPLRLTLKFGPRGDHFSAHVGVGFGGVLTDLRRALSFTDPNAQASFGQTTENETIGLETHVQLGADWRIGNNIGAGLLARWSDAPSTVALYRGYQGSTSASGAVFSESHSAGNVSGLFIGASGWWRF